MTTGHVLAIKPQRFKATAPVRRKTASGGLGAIPHRRLSRWRLQGANASGKNAASYDYARRVPHLPQSEKKLSQCMIEFLTSQGLGAPNLIDVRFIRGDGGRLAAKAAFKNGNPAITLGNNVYVRPSSWSRISSPSGGAVFFEKVVHSVQWEARGTFDFGLFYALGSLMGGLATGDMHNSPIEAQAIGMSKNLLRAYQKAGSPCQD